MDSVPEAKEALELIRDVYVVEHEAKERDIIGTTAHLMLRRTRSKPVMDALQTWLEARQGLDPPKSNMAVAVGYALKNWEPLTQFLRDAVALAVVVEGV